MGKANVIWKKPSARNSYLMTFWYGESQKHTRGERSSVICMAQAGINNKEDDFYLIFIKQCLQDNQVVRTNQVQLGSRPPNIERTEKI